MHVTHCSESSGLSVCVCNNLALLTTSTMELLQEEPTMITLCHTLTGDFVLGGKNKLLLEMYGSTVWHECVSEYVCMYKSFVNMHNCIPIAYGAPSVPKVSIVCYLHVGIPYIYRPLELYIVHPIYISTQVFVFISHYIYISAHQ